MPFRMGVIDSVSATHGVARKYFGSKRTRETSSSNLSQARVTTYNVDKAQDAMNAMEQDAASRGLNLTWSPPQGELSAHRAWLY